MDGLAIGIELDVSGIGDVEWAPAAEGCPDEPQAATTNATAAAPTPVLKAEPGLERPTGAYSDMG
jgi:hypothetical protein